MFAKTLEWLVWLVAAIGRAQPAPAAAPAPAPAPAETIGSIGAGWRELVESMRQRIEDMEDAAGRAIERIKELEASEAKCRQERLQDLARVARLELKIRGLTAAVKRLSRPAPQPPDLPPPRHPGDPPPGGFMR